MTLKELAAQVALIKDNHLAHLKEDVDRVEHKLEKMDARLWWVLGLLVASIVIPNILG
jgi:hypothetical protein